MKEGYKPNRTKMRRGRPLSDEEFHRLWNDRETLKGFLAACGYTESTVRSRMSRIRREKGLIFKPLL